jgi:iron complex transport system ATP-binding protein
LGLARPILADISWRVEAGEHWALVGENGSGKSTLLSIVSGELWPSRGVARVLGEEYGRVDKRELKKRIGVVSASLGAHLHGHDSAVEVASSGLDARIGQLGPLSTAERARGLAALAAIGAAEYADKTYGVLSQGERQRVLIARALINQPALLILDEACAGLDPVAREHFIDDLGALARTLGGPTQIHVTHHIEEIPTFVTHALLLKGGTTLFAGPVDRALTSERLTAAFGVRCHVTTRRDGNGRRFGLEIHLTR